MITIKLDKMLGVRDGILCRTEKGEFLLSFDEMSKYPNQPVPMGEEIKIENCGDGYAIMTIGRTKMKFSESWLRERNLL